jgi:hypothetical protein
LIVWIATLNPTTAYICWTSCATLEPISSPDWITIVSSIGLPSL